MVFYNPRLMREFLCSLPEHFGFLCRTFRFTANYKILEFFLRRISFLCNDVCVLDHLLELQRKCHFVKHAITQKIFEINPSFHVK